MAKEVYIPKLGQTVEEVQLVRWLIEDGAHVEVGQEILEVETDKAIFAVEATGRGVLHIDTSFKPGDTVPVLTVVGMIRGQGSGVRSQGLGGPRQETPDKRPQIELDAQNAELIAQNAKLFASPRARKLAAQRNVDLAALTPTGGNGTRIVERDVLAALAVQPSQAVQPRATPLAQRIAAANGVDLRGVAGSGPSGRITRTDVLGIGGQGSGVRSQKKGKELQALIPDPRPLTPVRERVPLAGIRKVITQRMADSSRTTARVTLMREVDATEFVVMRGRLKARVEQQWGFAPGYNDLIAKIVAGALREFPYMNACIADDAIEELATVNIGVAVDTERGLLVPVVRDADTKSVRQVGAELRALVEQARSGRINPDDLSGGTFTITNLGMFGVDAFTPIINLPEAAILGLGRIIEKPVMRGGAVVGRHMWTLSLAFDHRLTDGAPAARFLAYIAEVIEEPYLLVVA